MHDFPARTLPRSGGLSAHMAFSKKKDGATLRMWSGRESILYPKLDKVTSARSGKMKRGLALGFAGAAMTSLLCSSLSAQSLYRLGDRQIVPQAANNSGDVVGASSGQAFIYQSGRFQNLGTLPGHTRSHAEAITESGIVAGTSSTEESYRAFLYERGRMFDIGTLGGTNSYGYAVNTHGEVAGQSTLPGDTTHRGFLYSKGRMIDLGTLGGTSSSASGINNSGNVVGYSFIAGNKEAHAYLYSNGRMLDLGTLGGSFSMGTAINARGQVAGTSATQNGELHAFLYERGEMKDLGVVARTEHSDAFAINSAGQVVGRCYSSTGYEPAFLYSNGVMSDLNVLFDDLLSDGTTPGFVMLTEASSITDNGIIVGLGWFYRGDEYYEVAPFVLDTREGGGLNPF